MTDLRKFNHLPTSWKIKNLSEIESNLTKISRFKSEFINEYTPKLVIDEIETIDQNIYDEFIQLQTKRNRKH